MIELGVHLDQDRFNFMLFYCYLFFRTIRNWRRLVLCFPALAGHPGCPTIAACLQLCLYTTGLFLLCSISLFFSLYLKGDSHQILLSEMSLPGIEVLIEKLLSKVLGILGKENHF